jgi:hypothetical protein
MVQVGLTVFLGLFILSQMYEYLRQFTLPFPVYLLLGMALAIASNYQRKWD